MRTLERRGARVLNGADVFALELSKSAQATLLQTLGIDTPRSITFNDVSALRGAKRDRLAGGAEARSGRQRRAHPGGELDGGGRGDLPADPAVWLPDNLFLLQEYLPHDPEQGIVRLEFLGGELLYAMRVKTHGRFNLCPSPVCNPDDGDGVCEVPAATVAAPPVEFYPYPEVPATRWKRRRRSCTRRASTSAASSIWRRPTAGGVLRHQRQLEPASVGGGGVRLRSVRARGGLPGTPAGANAGLSRRPRRRYIALPPTMV